MNANSALTLQAWLKQAQDLLNAAAIPTARLDSQIIAAHVLGVDRGWVLAHPEHIFDTTTKRKLNTLLSRRTQREPMAYITGWQEFYGRSFTVTPDVLIPRPETEGIIEQLKTLSPTPGQRLCDVGTGSGIIAITAALEWPGLHVEACDTSPAALAAAQQNATKLGAKVRFFTSNLLHKASGQYNFITANLPYVDRIWQRSPETQHEPALALFANDGGLALIKRLLAQAPPYLAQNGFVLLEADPRQHTTIIKQLPNWRCHARTDYVLMLQPTAHQ